MAGIGFDQLADELLVLIFNGLDFINLRKSRLVNKRFKYVIDEFVRWNELIFRSNNNRIYWILSKEWIFTKKPIDNNRIIETKDWNMESFFENNLIGLKLLNNVKRIIISDDYCQMFPIIYFDYLTKFNQLEQFEFYSCTRDPERLKISQKNLKFLYIESDFVSLELDTPKLQAIGFNCIGRRVETIFHYPLTIEYFEIGAIHFFPNIKHFRALSNLKTFYVSYIGSPRDDLFKYSEILICYPKLVNLILFEPSFCSESLKLEFKGLLRKKEELKLKTQIQFKNDYRFDYLVVDSIEQLDEIFTNI